MSRWLFSILLVATATSHAGAQAPVVGESYYVRRVLEERGTSCGPADRPSCETRGRTTCTALAFDGTTLELTAERGSAIRFRGARAPDGSLALSSADVTVHHMRVLIELRASCTATVTFDDGQLFPDRASCLAVPSSFHAMCTGTSCMRDSLAGGAWVFHDDAPPLLAGDCERAVAALHARVALVTHADDAARERTFLRFRRIASGGGMLFERHEDACDAVSVSSPVVSGSTRANVFRTRWRTPDGGVTDQRAEYAVRPLLSGATLLSLSQSWQAPDGGMGGTGTGGQPTLVGLYFGDGVVLLEQRTLYLQRSRCARAR